MKSHPMVVIYVCLLVCLIQAVDHLHKSRSINEIFTVDCLSLGQVDGKANYHSMRKAYEHNLGVEGKHFTAYNMISGPFGNARARDMFMVQSLDGKLQIFEQSATAFTRQLMDCLLPGPIAYLPRLDAFVSTNYATQAECYRYQVRASHDYCRPAIPYHI